MSLTSNVLIHQTPISFSQLTDKKCQVDQQNEDLRQQMEIYNEWENKCNSAIERLEKLNVSEFVLCHVFLAVLNRHSSWQISVFRL